MRSRADIVAIVAIVVGAVPALMSALAVIGYVADEQGYGFGTEVAGYMYYSPGHYLVLNGLVVALFATVLVVRNWLVRISGVMLELAVLVIGVF